MKITLGQLFLLRRELKEDISNLKDSLTSIGFYREDKDPPEEDFNTEHNVLAEKQDLLFKYDVAVNKANNVPGTVVFNDYTLSLVEARILKASIGSSLETTAHYLRNFTHFNNKEESEQVWDTSVTPAAMRPQKYKFKMVADLAVLKQTVNILKKNISLLDSLIQKADWTLEIHIPG